MYREYTPRLYRIAWQLCLNTDDANELVQLTWIRALEKMDQYRKESAFATWLTGILININREKKRADSRHDFEELESATDIKTVPLNLSDKKEIEKAIAALPLGYRQAIILHDVEGFTHEEIGQLLSIEPGTSKSQLFHARKLLRKYLHDFKHL